jgi:peptidoglycan/LPS O-acetylase OafA/YrhL
VRRYTAKRLVRIFPAYLPLAVTLIVLYAAFPGFSATGGRDYSLVSSLLLVPADRPPVLSVAWTLVHELLFYSIFLLFFVSRRVFVGALVAWAALIIGTNLIIGNNLTFESTNWLRYPLSLLNIEFMLGVAAAWIVTGAVPAGRPNWLVVGGIGVAVAFLAAMEISGIDCLRLGFAFGLALMIVGFARWEQSATARWPTFLVLLGNASYSIYLVHNPVLSVAQRLSKHAGFNWISGLILGVVMALAAGYLYHAMLERRAVRFFGSRMGRKSTQPAHA